MCTSFSGTYLYGFRTSGKTDAAGQGHAIVGLIDHGTRVAIERYGKPNAVRTDNEPIFTSRLFSFGLWLLGIRRQRTDLHCPWMNGCIERFFATLKHKLDRWAVPDREALNASLAEFRLWYNHIRPHHPGRLDRTPRSASISWPV